MQKLPPVIYGLLDPRDGSVRYVGQTKDLRRRLERHIEHKYWWHHSLRYCFWRIDLYYHGLEPLLDVLEYCIEEDLLEREKHWINHGFNIGWPLLNDRGTTSWSYQQKDDVRKKFDDYRVEKSLGYDPAHPLTDKELV